MSKKYYRLYCEICNWKKVTDGSEIDGLVEVKTSPVPGGVPKFDPIKNKTITPKSIKQLKKYKCPKCGRVVTPRKITNPQEKIDQYNAEQEREKERKQWEALEKKAIEKYERTKVEYEEEQDRIDRS